MERIEVPWNKAKDLLYEGDVALVRGNGIYSWWIKHFTRGEYSHAGLIGFCGNFIELVHFREFEGGRSISLKREVNHYPGQIDIYRLIPEYNYCKYDSDVQKIEDKKIVLDGTILRKITNVMREWSGRDYGWGLIWKLMKQRLPFLRILYSPSFEDEKEDANDYTPVCSSSVVAAIRFHYFDIVPNLSDADVTPNDISHSAGVKYLFTLVP